MKDENVQGTGTLEEQGDLSKGAAPADGTGTDANRPPEGSGGEVGIGEDEARFQELMAETEEYKKSQLNADRKISRMGDENADYRQQIQSKDQRIAELQAQVNRPNPTPPLAGEYYGDEDEAIRRLQAQVTERDKQYEMAFYGLADQHNQEINALRQEFSGIQEQRETANEVRDLQSKYGIDEVSARAVIETAKRDTNKGLEMAILASRKVRDQRRQKLDATRAAGASEMVGSAGTPPPAPDDIKKRVEGMSREEVLDLIVSNPDLIEKIAKSK